eukprot:6334645-Heterocapsa_arctica.AAC.1
MATTWVERIHEPRPSCTISGLSHHARCAGECAKRTPSGASTSKKKAGRMKTETTAAWMVLRRFAATQ